MIETPTIDKQLPLYEQVADRVAQLIAQGAFRPGDKVPSIRTLSSQLKVSINTVKQAYASLEDRRVLEARPQSGYFVRGRRPAAPVEPDLIRRELSPTDVSISELARMILRDSLNPELLQFGVNLPDPAQLPIERLNRMMASEIRRHPELSVSYSIPPGYSRLREQIAKHMLTAGCTLHPDEVVITIGCMEAVFLALKALCQPGDTVAVESPTFFNFLQLIEELGLRALEIPTSPSEGISLDALGYALEHNEVSACLVVTNYNNPLGSLVPDDKKRQLVELLARHDIPLIEDDIHGDLSHADQRPGVAKNYDRTGNVLLCSSFTKTIAPGHRVGWIAAGRHQQRIEALKMVVNVASTMPTQMAMAEFLANGGYQRHLRKIRRTYARKTAQLGEAIGRYFPAGTRVSRPEGGYCLWVELPEHYDSLKLYAHAIEQGLTIAPGPLFSATGKFQNCVRLNAAFWTADTAPAIAQLGRLIAAQD